MTNVLTGIYNFLNLVEENWTLIITIVGLGFSIYKKITDYIRLAEEQRIQIAKSHLKDVMLGICTEAELSWVDYKKSGSIKRSLVIDNIFERYPILLKVTNQDDLLRYIDALIDEALIEVRKVVEGIDTTN